MASRGLMRTPAHDWWWSVNFGDASVPCPPKMDVLSPPCRPIDSSSDAVARWAQPLTTRSASCQPTIRSA
eukprot:4485575-Pyramimonas_sp.AAC.1